MPLLWVMEKCPVPYQNLSSPKSVLHLSFHKTLQNSAGNPSEPGVFLVSIVFRPSRHSVSIKVHSCFVPLRGGAYHFHVQRSQKGQLTSVRLHFQRITSSKKNDTQLRSEVTKLFPFSFSWLILNCLQFYFQDRH